MQQANDNRKEGQLVANLTSKKVYSCMSLHSSAALEKFRHQNRHNNEGSKRRIKATEDALGLLKARCNSVSLIHQASSHPAIPEQRQDEKSNYRVGQKQNGINPYQSSHGGADMFLMALDNLMGNDDSREQPTKCVVSSPKRSSSEQVKMMITQRTTTTTTCQTQLENKFHEEQERRRQAQEKVTSLSDQVSDMARNMAKLEQRYQREERLRREAEAKALSLYEKVTNLELELAVRDAHYHKEERLRKECEEEMTGLRDDNKKMQSELETLRASDNQVQSLPTKESENISQNQMELLHSVLKKDQELAQIRKELAKAQNKNKVYLMHDQQLNLPKKTGKLKEVQCQLKNKHGAGVLATIRENSLINEDATPKGGLGTIFHSIGEINAPSDENTNPTRDDMSELSVDMSSRTSTQDVTDTEESYSVASVVIETSRSEISNFLDNVPMHLKLSYEQVGFYCDEEHQSLHRPVLCVDPWSVPPGPIQTELLNHPGSMLGIYFYAENDISKAYKAIKWFKFISYSRGQNKILHRVPGQIESRRIAGNLSEMEKSYCKAIKIIKEEAKKNLKARMHPFHATYRKDLSYQVNAMMTSPTDNDEEQTADKSHRHFFPEDEISVKSSKAQDKVELLTTDLTSSMSERNVRFVNQNAPGPVLSIVDSQSITETVEVIVNIDVLNNSLSSSLGSIANGTGRDHLVLREREQTSQGPTPVEQHPVGPFASTKEKVFQAMQCIRPQHAASLENEESFAPGSTWTSLSVIGGALN